MMYWISQESGETLTMNQLQYCVKRNFGGKTDVDKTVNLFLEEDPSVLPQTEQHTHASNIKVHKIKYS